MALGIKEIQEIIPHRYPFLLVDKVEELEPGKRAVGYKNVTMNEYFFQGHFPEGLCQVLVGNFTFKFIHYKLS